MQQSADPAYIPQKNAIFCKIKYIIWSWVQWKILLQKWIITKIAVYVSNVTGLFWFTDCVQKGGHSFLEKGRGVPPTTLFCSSLALQIQICLHEKRNQFKVYIHYIFNVVICTQTVSLMQLIYTSSHYFKLTTWKKVPNLVIWLLTFKKISKSMSLVKSVRDSPKIPLISSSLYMSLNAFSFTIKAGKSPNVTLPFWFFKVTNYNSRKKVHTR